MTTKEAEARYLEEHMSKWGDKNYAVFNPDKKPIEELPFILGFNNGGSPGWYSGVLITEDGEQLGGHICSDEGYMYHDLGIVEGSRPDRHITFQQHYPEGYRMDFIPFKEVMTDKRLDKAVELNQEKHVKDEEDGHED